jgi:HK97 family phage portal protein
MNLRSLIPWGGSRAKALEEKNETLRIFRELYGARTSTKSGKDVSFDQAIKVSTVLRCAAVIADGVSSVPLKLYKADYAKRTRQVASDHPMYRLLARRPNPWMTSFEFREAITMQAVLCGNAFVYKNMVRGRVVEMMILDPGRVSIKRKPDWSVEYTYRPINGPPEVLNPDAVWHIKGPSYTGYAGIEAVTNAREAIGLSMALEESHASLHRNGVQSSGVYSVDGSLSEAQYERLRKYIQEEHATSNNSGKPFILDRGAKWQALTMNGVDAQHLETRRFQIEEICRMFGVMPIMVGYSDKAATYASAEQMFLAHNIHCIRPWHRRLEASMANNFLTPEEEEAGYYFKFLDSEMLRGDAKTRSEYYMKGIQAGWMTRNEAREWEELDPIEGLDAPLMPANMVPVGEEPDEDDLDEDDPEDTPSLSSEEEPSGDAQ